jgi:hypothetical protein
VSVLVQASLPDSIGTVRGDNVGPFGLALDWTNADCFAAYFTAYFTGAAAGAEAAAGADERGADEPDGTFAGS